MDWLDEAAKKHSEIEAIEKDATEKKEILKEKYPRMVGKLFDMFEDFYRQAESKFGGYKVFNTTGSGMQLKLGGIEVRATPSPTERTGGYFGLIRLEVKYLNSNSTIRIPHDELLLGYVDDSPTWVYRGYEKGVTTDVAFSQADVEEIFKIAFSIYK